MTTAARGDRGSLAQGILTMTVFGLAWALVGVSGLTGSVPGRVVGYVLAAIVAMVVAVGALRSPPGDTPRQALSRNPGRDFVLVNLAQTVLILVAVVVFVRVDRPVLIAPAACVVVGLHFLPLARIFGIPLYVSTGAILLVAGVLGFALFAAGASAVLVTVGFAAAVTLWGTSLLLPRYG